MIIVKTGVVFNRLLPEIYNLFPIIEEVWNHFNQVPVITSANDGKHMQGSRHYTDQAIDLRSKTLDPEQKQHALSELRRRAGRDYDILLECEGTENEHLHLEWDRKRG